MYASLSHAEMLASNNSVAKGNRKEKELMDVV
jgi:hypothetical protein